MSDALESIAKNYGKVNEFPTEYPSQIAKNYGKVKNEFPTEYPSQCFYETKILNSEADLYKLQSTVGHMMVEIENLKEEISTLKKNTNSVSVKKVHNHVIPNNASIKTIDSPIKHLDESVIQEYKERAKRKRSTNDSIELNTCAKCKGEFDVKLMFKIFDQRHGSGNVSYECSNEKECYQRANVEKIALEQERRMLLQKFGNYEKEEQLKAMYGINFDDLEEIPFRTRDASIHYNYFPKSNEKDDNENCEQNDENDKKERKPTNPTKFTWCWGDHTWNCRTI